MDIEILCATMGQKNFNKYEDMNIQTNVVFANQDDRMEWQETNMEGHQVKMITTSFRGVGNNRNMGILFSKGDILMFSDDDMYYNNGYEAGVLQAFSDCSDADMIVFHCSTHSHRKTPDISKITRIRTYNFMRYGTVGFAIKRESLLKKNLMFSQLFGGGSRYCGGEDNIFLREALKKGLKVYAHPYSIAKVNNDKSTWFEGYNEKHFFDNGALLHVCFPVMKYFLIFYFVFRFRKKTKVSKIQILRLQLAGISSYKRGWGYLDWKGR